MPPLAWSVLGVIDLTVAATCVGRTEYATLILPKDRLQLIAHIMVGDQSSAFNSSRRAILARSRLTYSGSINSIARWW